MKEMKTINLKASAWSGILDFYEELLEALDAPFWHGRSIDALIDSMVWGGVSGVEPPYIVRIIGLHEAPQEIQHEIQLIKECIDEARLEFHKIKGHHVDVQIEIIKTK